MDYSTRFAGISSLYSSQSLEKLNNSHCLVVGLGGVGSWVVESLVRSGVGEITLVDLDDICVSNTNRQIHAYESNYGELKIDAMAARAKSINPDCRVNTVHGFLTKNSVEKIFKVDFDFVVHAIDSVNDKCVLINHCYQNKIPMVICGGAGGKSDPTRIKITDLSKTKNDLLLRHVRKKLKKEYNFPLGWTRARIKTVYSDELAKKIELCDAASSSSKKLDCSGGLGAITHMTGTMGFFATHVALTYLISQDK